MYEKLIEEIVSEKDVLKNSEAKEFVFFKKMSADVLENQESFHKLISLEAIDTEGVELTKRELTFRFKEPLYIRYLQFWMDGRSHLKMKLKVLHLDGKESRYLDLKKEESQGEVYFIVSSPIIGFKIKGNTKVFDQKVGKIVIDGINFSDFEDALSTMKTFNTGRSSFIKKAEKNIDQVVKSVKAVKLKEDEFNSSLDTLEVKKNELEANKKILESQNDELKNTVDDLEITKEDLQGKVTELTDKETSLKVEKNKQEKLIANLNSNIVSKEGELDLLRKESGLYTENLKGINKQEIKVILIKSFACIALIGLSIWSLSFVNIFTLEAIEILKSATAANIGGVTASVFLKIICGGPFVYVIYKMAEIIKNLVGSIMNTVDSKTDLLRVAWIAGETAKSSLENVELSAEKKAMIIRKYKTDRIVKYYMSNDLVKTLEIEEEDSEDMGPENSPPASMMNTATNLDKEMITTPEQ